MFPADIPRSQLSPRSLRAARAWLLLLALVLNQVGSARAQDLPGSIEGVVRSREGGDPLPHARLVLMLVAAADGDSVRVRDRTTWSGPGGLYLFRELPQGRYALRTRAYGYLDRTDSVTVGPVPLHLEIDLETSPFHVAPVDVGGLRPQGRQENVPGEVTLSTAQVKAMPSVGEADLIRSLQLLPGVQAASDLSSGLYVRGGGPDQTLILLDGVPVYNPTHAFGFFSTFNPSAVEEGSLYKGAYPSPYGGRLGAVLDVSNRDGSGSGLHGNGGVSIVAGRITVEGPIRNGSWIVSGRRTYLDPILDAVRNDSTEIPSYYFYDLNGRLHRSFGESDNGYVSAYHGRDAMHLDLDQGTWIDMRWGNLTGSARWTHRFSGPLVANLLVSGSEYSSETEAKVFGTPFQFSNSVREWSTSADLEWRPSRTHGVRGGVGATFYRFRLSQAFNQVPQGGFTQEPASLTAFVEDRWNPSALWSVRPGLRAEAFGGQPASLEPRLQVQRVLTPELSVHAGGGGYSQHLQLVSTEGFSGTDFWVPNDATAKAGRSWQTVAGADWEVLPAHTISIEGYYTWLRNLVQLDNMQAADSPSATTEDIFFTDGQGRTKGVEVMLQRRRGGITGWIGYTLGFSDRTWPEMNQGKTFPPKYDRRHDLKIVLQASPGHWSFGTDFIYGTGQAFTPLSARYSLTDPAGGQTEEGILLPGVRNSARLLPYHRLDLNVTRHGHLFGARADWYVQVFNVYNRKNEWFIQYDTSDPETLPKIIHQLPIIPTIGVNFEF
jgi:hypothetical protein